MLFKIIKGSWPNNQLNQRKWALRPECKQSSIKSNGLSGRNIIVVVVVGSQARFQSIKYNQKGSQAENQSNSSWALRPVSKY